ncbi:MULTISPECIES: hypothetical protein [unclassified Vibrio]|nr:MULTISPECIES: hypothetical protein [unclassified Vibrio]NAW90993.1 hypothetical protein [Vibrio sp. V24_P1S3T111]
MSISTNSTNSEDTSGTGTSNRGDIEIKLYDTTAINVQVAVTQAINV